MKVNKNGVKQRLYSSCLLCTLSKPVISINKFSVVNPTPSFKSSLSQVKCIHFHFKNIVHYKEDLNNLLSPGLEVFQNFTSANTKNEKTGLMACRTLALLGSRADDLGNALFISTSLPIPGKDCEPYSTEHLSLWEVTFCPPLSGGKFFWSFYIAG